MKRLREAGIMGVFQFASSTVGRDVGRVFSLAGGLQASPLG
jgi:hypothetical protein